MRSVADMSSWNADFCSSVPACPLSSRALGIRALPCEHVYALVPHPPTVCMERAIRAASRVSSCLDALALLPYSQSTPQSFCLLVPMGVPILMPTYVVASSVFIIQSTLQQ